MQIQLQTVGQNNHLIIKISYPNVNNLTYNFKLEVAISRQNGGGAPLVNKVLYVPEKEIKIGPLVGNQIFKIEVKCVMNSQTSIKNAFCFVPEARNQDEDQMGYSQFSSDVAQSLPVESRLEQRRQKLKNSKERVKQVKRQTFSNSQSLMKLVGKSVGITNQKKLDRYILESRKCRNTNEFLNSRKQFQSGSKQRAIQKQKMLLKGKMVQRDIYHQKQGMNFFKNDWFMGPFYSYDHNEQQIAKE